MHRNDLLADLGCLRAHEDWNKLVAPVKLFKGGISARYNWMSVSVPECLPGRLEILAYANEIVFLHDDVIESVDKSKVRRLAISTSTCLSMSFTDFVVDRATSSMTCLSKASIHQPQGLPPIDRREAR